MTEYNINVPEQTLLIKEGETLTLNLKLSLTAMPQTGGGGGPALWTPSELETGLWLDAADAGTITEDGVGRIDVWADKSGNGNNATSINNDGVLFVSPTLSVANSSLLPMVAFNRVERLDTPAVTMKYFAAVFEKNSLGSNNRFQLCTLFGIENASPYANLTVTPVGVNLGTPTLTGVLPRSLCMIECFMPAGVDFSSFGNTLANGRGADGVFWGEVVACAEEPTLEQRTALYNHWRSKWGF